MKPCRHNRKRIAWLALAESGPHADIAWEQEPALRQHLEQCEPCRQYLAEMSALAGRLAGLASNSSEPEPSERLHRRVVRGLYAAKKHSYSPVARVWVGFSWRFALPVALFLVIAGLFAARQAMIHPVVLSPTHMNYATSRGASPVTASDYLWAANRSLAQFDDLLTRQSRQNLPPAPPLNVANLIGSEP